MTHNETRVENALEALDRAEADTAADFGENAVDEAYFDLVESVGMDLNNTDRREFYRRTGKWMPGESFDEFYRPTAPRPISERARAIAEANRARAIDRGKATR